MSKPTIVIVPGAWQKPVSWDGFSQKLNDAGYPTEYVAMPTVGGTETPLAGLAEDVAAVRSVLSKLAGEGKPTLLLGHSSGGLVASNAVAGFDVVGIIFLSAFMIPSGKSLLDCLGGQPLPWMYLEDGKIFGVPELIPQVAFNDLDAEGQAKWSKEMTHTSAALFATPSGFEPWANGVSSGYIFCEDDNALPLPIQQQMAIQLGPDPAVVRLKAGHCPFLSIPDELLKAVQTLESRLK